jgi:cell division protein FtsL
MTRETIELTAAGFLLVAIVATGVTKLTTVHESRRLFQEFEELKREQDRLLDDWSRWQIEQGRLASHARVDMIAREDLGLVEPDEQRVFVEPQR